MAMKVNMRMRVIVLTAFVLCCTAVLLPLNLNRAVAEPEVTKVQLYATDGYYTLADGKKIYIWGYSLENKKGSASIPGPKIEAVEGRQLDITVTNIGPEKTQSNWKAYPLYFSDVETPAAPEIPLGQSYTQTLTAPASGSYFYYSQDPERDAFQLGMNGAFVVKPGDNAQTPWQGGPVYDQEYVFHLNEVDPTWNEALESGAAYDRDNFHPRYWTINGKSFPQVMNDPESSISGKLGETVFVRLINPGYQEHPMHMHGHHFFVVAVNGVPLEKPVEMDTVNVRPNDRVDIIVNFDQSGNYPFHSHKILDNTNNGVYPGGMHTMVYISPEMKKEEMTLKIGQASAVIDGHQEVPLEFAPFLVKDEPYIPLQLILDQFKANVVKNNKDKSFIYSANQHHATFQLQLWLNQTRGLLNGKEIELAAPAVMQKSKYGVPLSLLDDYLCTTTDYDTANGTIHIAYTPGAVCKPGDGNPHQPPVVEAVPPGGTYEGPVKVELIAASEDPNVSIYYTTDGLLPTHDSTPYTGPITIERDTTLRFIAIDSYHNVSQVITESYTIKQQENVHIVYMKNSVFSPKVLTIKKGDTVKWVNNDTMSHAVTEVKGLVDGYPDPDKAYFTSDAWMGENDEFSFTFDKVGTWEYACWLHIASMRGTIIVEE